jgi:hypothetical protein
MTRLGWTSLALALVACHESTGPRNDLDALRIGVRVVPNRIVAGTPATINITLTNPLSRPLTVSSCPIYFWVQNAFGQVVGGDRSGICVAFALVYLPLTLQPSETRTISFQWPATETLTVPPGMYRAYGWVNDAAHASAPALVTILPPN